jgi:Flp pilus assembly protein TadG
MVEYALIVIPFFLLVMGIFDFGRGILYYNMISNAAREAARAGILGPEDEVVCQRAVDATHLPGVPADHTCTASGDYPQTAQPSALTVDTQYLTATDEGDIPVVEVTLTYSFDLITPLIGNITGNPLTLRASSQMYVERPPAGPLPTTTPAGTPAPTSTPAGTPLPTSTPGAPTATPLPTTPTATPSGPTPTPGPSVTPTATPIPPTPTASPSPTPKLCQVPTFIFQRDDVAQAMWSGNDFTTTVVFTGNGNKVKSQSLPAGTMQSCSVTITLGF